MQTKTKPSQIGPELGTAQPQLVYIFVNFFKVKFFFQKLEKKIKKNAWTKNWFPYKNWYGELVPVEEVSPLASAPLALARYSIHTSHFA